jgi:hypothetical protein
MKNQRMEKGILKNGNNKEENVDKQKESSGFRMEFICCFHN